MNYFKCLIFSIILLFYYNSCLFSQINKENDFNLPLKIPIRLSANYGELRTNHFHSGIDIKTQGKTGIPVYAVEDGYVYRLKIRITGYGRTIYLNHPNGYTSVYGHLDHFSPKIEEYVKNLQYNNRSYEIDDFPGKETFEIKKGDIIAYSGNSGYSFGPHLHFEIRETTSEIPINPLAFYTIPDTIPPQMFSLFIYPIISDRFIKASREFIEYPIFKNGRKYKLIKDTIATRGIFNLGIGVYDLLNDSRNKCGIYSLELFVNDEQIFYAKLNNISFNETRYVNSYMDYKINNESKRKVHKLFKDPDNLLSVYQNIINNSRIIIPDSEVVKIKIIIKDIYENTSYLEFFAQNLIKEEFKNTNNIECLNVMPCFESNEINKSDIKIYFPENTFYDTICFNYAKVDFQNSTYNSPIYYINNINVPVHKKYKLSIKPITIPDKLKDKTVICRLEEDEEDDKYDEFESSYEDSFIVAYPNSLGKFVLIVDTIPPKIIPHNFINKSKNDFSNKERIEFKIVDEISGLMSYNGFIDDKWVLFEYDKKNDMLFYIFDKNRLDYNILHQLKLIVSDYKNNIEIFESSFYK